MLSMFRQAVKWTLIHLTAILGWRWPSVLVLLVVAISLSLWIVFLVPGADESAVHWTLSALAQSVSGVLAIVVLLFTVLWTQSGWARDGLERAQDDIYDTLTWGRLPSRLGLQVDFTQKLTCVGKIRNEFCASLKEKSPSLAKVLSGWCDREKVTPETYYMNLCAIVQITQNRLVGTPDSDLDEMKGEGLQAGLELEAARKVSFPGGRTAILPTDFHETVRLRTWDMQDPEALTQEISRSVILGPLRSLPSGPALQECLFTVFERHRVFRHIENTRAFRQFLRADFAAIIASLATAIALALLFLSGAGRISPYLMIIPMMLALFGAAFLIVHWYRLVVSPTAREAKRLSQKI